MTDSSPYKPMYKVKPYFVIRKIKLPDCMYVVKPIHQLPPLASDEQDYQQALDSMELKQEKIFDRIEELKAAVVKMGQESGLDPAEMQRLTENHKVGDTPQDVVVTTPTSFPPYPLLALYQYIKKTVPVCLKSFVHSSAVGRVSPQLMNQFNCCSCARPLLKITVIWKDIEESTMMCSPGKQVPISGISNICRYVSRQYCTEIYESLPPVISSQSDTWLDLFSLLYLHGNAKEKGSVIRQMNSALGSKGFLTGDTPTLADIVLYGIIGTEKGVKVTGNVKKWMVRCHGVTEMKTVPCLYIEQQ